MIYAVIDTNVLVSALLTSHADSATVMVMNAVINGDIIPMYNKEILKEYEEVLSRKTPVVVTPAEMLRILAEA